MQAQVAAERARLARMAPEQLAERVAQALSRTSLDHQSPTAAVAEEELQPMVEQTVQAARAVEEPEVRQPVL